MPFGIRQQCPLVSVGHVHRTRYGPPTQLLFGMGFALNAWLRGGAAREQVLERLRPLLALPVEVVLPAHGAATDRAALERALS